MIQFYNDDYRPLMAEKHPKALGQRARECWKEAWHIIGPQFEATLFEGKTTFQENVLVPVIRDGELRDIYWTYSYSPIHQSDGVAVGIIIVCQDKTDEILSAQEHQRLEGELRTERSRLLNLVRQAAAFIAVLRGPSHVFEVVNHRYQELVGDRSLIGKTVDEALPEAGPQGFIAILDRVYQTGVAHVENGVWLGLDRSLGEVREKRCVDYVYQPMREADGHISGVIALGIDVTERRRAEQTLMSTEKLAEIGRLTSSIAHEINNPLEAVTNLLYLARGDAGLSSQTEEYLVTAEMELRRVSVITNQTLSFFKKAAQPQLA